MLIINNQKFKFDYSKRVTKGILGFPHRKRLNDISKHCSNFTDRLTLDIGCSDLFFDQNVIPFQKIFIGCDLGWESGLNLAKENVIKYGWNNVNLIKSVGEYIPLVDSHFDLILCLETLEHVEDENSVIKEIKRVSKNDAILVIAAPVEFGPILFLKQFFRYLIYHSKMYSLREMLYGCLLCDLTKVTRVKHTHKGYDYRKTTNLLAPEFKLIKKVNTPFNYLPDIISYGTILIFEKSNSLNE